MYQTVPSCTAAGYIPPTVHPNSIVPQPGLSACCDDKLPVSLTATFLGFGERGPPSFSLAGEIQSVEIP
jgi:hypothetical protein